MSTDTYTQSSTSAVYGGTISLITVAAIAVPLRFTARRISAATLWWDDWTLVVALVSWRHFVYRLPTSQSWLTHLKILDFSLCTGYWVQVRVGGLGHHSAAVGGPIDEHGISNYFKVSQQWSGNAENICH